MQFHKTSHVVSLLRNMYETSHNVTDSCGFALLEETIAY